MDIISHLQQLLAEAKYVEAQKESEIWFMDHPDFDPRVIRLYLDALQAQAKKPPTQLLLKLIDYELAEDSVKARALLALIDGPDASAFAHQILILRIRLAYKCGMYDELYQRLLELHLHHYEHRIPVIPAEIRQIVQELFPADFALKLHGLAFDLLRMDLRSAETKTRDLLILCRERLTTKGARKKITKIHQVLGSVEILYQLDLYRNLCGFLIDGLQNKKDLKKIIECIIYIDDFKTQCLILDLMLSLGIEEAAVAFAPVLRANPEYDFVYFDKYYPRLKTFFLPQQEKKKIIEESKLDIDLTLEEAPKMTPAAMEELSQPGGEEELLGNLIQMQEFSPAQLLDLAVSFLQSELPRTALFCCNQGLRQNPSVQYRLKASYLRITALMKLKDYRGALDVSLEAMENAQSENDLLSFLYSQSEAYALLNDLPNARKVLRKIISINANYRLARERLERLDEI